MSAVKNLSIRLSAVGGDKVRQEFKNLGNDGDKAFRRITQVITPANDNLKALDATARSFNEVRDTILSNTNNLVEQAQNAAQEAVSAVDEAKQTLADTKNYVDSAIGPWVYEAFTSTATGVNTSTSMSKGKPTTLTQTIFSTNNGSNATSGISVNKTFTASANASYIFLNLKSTQYYPTVGSLTIIDNS